MFSFRSRRQAERGEVRSDLDLIRHWLLNVGIAADQTQAYYEQEQALIARPT